MNEAEQKMGELYAVLSPERADDLRQAIGMIDKVSMFMLANANLYSPPETDLKHIQDIMAGITAATIGAMTKQTSHERVGIIDGLEVMIRLMATDFMNRAVQRGDMTAPDSPEHAQALYGDMIDLAHSHAMLALERLSKGGHLADPEALTRTKERMASLRQ